MQTMTLGGYTFWRNPEQFDEPRLKRFTAEVPTYGGSAFFSWGTFLAGQVIILEWSWMDETMWDQLQTLLEADTQIVWDPQTGSTYNVEITKLEGAYVESALVDASWRQKVKVELLIRSAV
jgi:hypothetical protein